ncbi:class I mannose-6-phosphate isomerase [Microbacterium kribbense]|uniref:Class I mannose-6-phosphate isomerase n=1 Tax=Microbacterium kribbense TaxID=433645 RepID=A0ABP7G4A4_9MICO
MIAPVVLGENRPTPRPYRGGAAIERFRRLADSGQEWLPEDFVASTVTTFGSAEQGLTVIDGITLRDRIAADPAEYLGEAHLAAFGADTKLLSKLLHTGDRIFVHAHPDGAYAQRELHLANGKTEAWIILDVDGGQGSAWVGFRDDVDEATLATWFQTQDAATMLGAMNEITLRPGDVLFVPAGIPHSIGAGMLILELQEPADLSIILEYAPYERLTKADSLLGLDEATALRAVTRAAVSAAQIDGWLGRVSPGSFLPAAAAAFFRAEGVVVTAGHDVELAAQFAVLVVTEGAGELAWDGGVLAVRAGDTVLIPFGAGTVRVSGDLTAVRGMPPAAG